MSTPDRCGWIELAGQASPRPMVEGEQRTDFAIIGGGLTGLAAARRLAELKPESRIMLIDAKRIGQGASARNSGFAVANESPGHAQLDTRQGHDSYMTMNRIDHAGVTELRRLIDEYGIDCQWEDTGSIHAAHDPKYFGRLRHHAEAFGRLGVDARLLDADELRLRLGTVFYGLGVESRGGALLQPGMLCRGLIESLPAPVECFENSPVVHIARKADGWLLTLPKGTVHAANLIVAVNAFFPRLGLKKDRVFPLALTASLTRPLTEDEEGLIGRPASWGILSPRSLGATMRLTKYRRILIRNTAEYLPEGISEAMLSARKTIHVEGLKRRFPFLGSQDIDYSWTGSICISRNSKPVFLEKAPGLFLCGGYNASGVSRGTIMGKLIAEMAVGSQSELLSAALSLTKPSRLPPRPFLDMGVRFRLMSERIAAKSEY